MNVLAGLSLFVLGLFAGAFLVRSSAIHLWRHDRGWFSRHLDKISNRPHGPGSDPPTTHADLADEATELRERAEELERLAADCRLQAGRLEEIEG